jgi:hypothetical protein
MTCSDCITEFVVEADSQPPANAPHDEPSLTSSASDQGALRRLLNPALEDPPPGEDRIRLDDGPELYESPKKQPVLETDYEFSLNCHICGTRMHLDDSYVGKKIKCPDCHTHLDVREPPPGSRTEKAETPPARDGDELNLAAAPIETAAPDLYRSIADDLLQQAAEEVATETSTSSGARPDPAQDALHEANLEADEEERETPKLPKAPFRTGIIKFLLEPTTPVMLLFLSLGLWIELGVVQYAIETASGEGIQQIISVLFRMVAVTLGVLYAAALSVSMLGIMQDTSGGLDRIESWPDANFLEWIVESVFIASALFMSVFPAAVAAKVASLLGASDVVFWTITCVGGAVGVIVAFPFLLLSMLEAGSMFAPFSWPMFRSLWLAARSWVTFLILSAGFATGLGCLAFARFAWRDSIFGNAILAALLVLVSAFYFRFLGRLAWCCEDAVSEADSDAEQAAPEEEIAAEQAPARQLPG